MTADDIHPTKPIAAERDGRLVVVSGVPYVEIDGEPHVNALTASILGAALEEMLKIDNQLTIRSWVSVKAEALTRGLRPEGAE